MFANQGSFSLKGKRLAEHEGSDVHKMHAQSGAASKVFKQMRSNMIQENDYILMNLMTAAFNLFKMNIPLEKFPQYYSSMELQTIRFDMEQQDAEGNCPYQFPITFFSPQLGDHYRHRRAAKDFGYFIFEALRADQCKRVCTSSVFGHAIDEATDKSKQQHLAQCVLYVCCMCQVTQRNPVLLVTLTHLSG